MQTPTMQKEHGLDIVPSTPRQSRLLLTLSILLAVALVAMAVWVVVDRFVFAPPSAGEMVTAVDETIAAWDQGDTDAIRDLYATDAVFYDGPFGTSPMEGSEAIAAYVGSLDTMGFVIQRAGPTQVIDDVAVTVVNFGGEGDLSPAMSMQQFDSDGLTINHWYLPLDGVLAAT